MWHNNNNNGENGNINSNEMYSNNGVIMANK
jgi:hypothetical protein